MKSTIVFLTMLIGCVLAGQSPLEEKFERHRTDLLNNLKPIFNDELERFYKKVFETDRAPSVLAMVRLAPRAQCEEYVPKAEAVLERVKSDLTKEEMDQFSESIDDDPELDHFLTVFGVCAEVIKFEKH